LGAETTSDAKKLSRKEEDGEQEVRYESAGIINDQLDELIVKKS
jgi:hypothetical protein